jgi:hypothetical protein
LLFIQKMLQRHHHGYDQRADAHTVVETRTDEQDAMMQKLSEPEEIARSGYSSRRLALLSDGQDGEPLIIDFGRSFFMKEEGHRIHCPHVPPHSRGLWTQSSCAPGPCRHAQDPYQVTRLTARMRA